MNDKIIKTDYTIFVFDLGRNSQRFTISYSLTKKPSAAVMEIKEQCKAHLSRRLKNPYIDSPRIRGYMHHYKIKLRSAGYRLVYEVEEKEVTVYVICVGRRDTIYKILKKRKSNKNQ